ncbi:MAG: hypothetical protein LBF40_07780 [Deltaproteobacteria bacterium]|jgi:homocitrate synthase NifV|nr:hypothetical protein [Deltaproteobacteria bacterium]
MPLQETAFTREEPLGDPPTVTQGSDWSLDEPDGDFEDYQGVPLLIDVTLPVYHPKAPGLVARNAQRWRDLLLGIGVTKVKTPSSNIRSTDCVAGLDSALLGDFPGIFRDLIALEPPEMLFGNRYGCATALAAAWLEAGGRGVVCAMGGAGGLPALEELRMALHTSGRLPLSGGEGNLAKLRELSELFSGERTKGNKPVTGFAIFAVESGVHVDGLLKDPCLYEPYPPNLVGGRRLLSVGLHSGRNSLRLKCEGLGLPHDGELLKAMATEVRALSLGLGRGLTDTEFVSLHGRLSAKGDKGKAHNTAHDKAHDKAHGKAAARAADGFPGLGPGAGRSHA